MAAEIFEQLIDLPFLLEQGDNCHCAAAFIADEGVYLIDAFAAILSSYIERDYSQVRQRVLQFMTQVKEWK